jgi:hypothetical protein
VTLPFPQPAPSSYHTLALRNQALYVIRQDRSTGERRVERPNEVSTGPHESTQYGQDRAAPVSGSGDGVIGTEARPAGVRSQPLG